MTAAPVQPAPPNPRRPTEATLLRTDSMRAKSVRTGVSCTETDRAFERSGRAVGWRDVQLPEDEALRSASEPARATRDRHVLHGIEGQAVITGYYLPRPRGEDDVPVGGRQGHAFHCFGPRERDVGDEREPPKMRRGAGALYMDEGGVGLGVEP